MLPVAGEAGQAELVWSNSSSPHFCACHIKHSVYKYLTGRTAEVHNVLRGFLFGPLLEDRKFAYSWNYEALGLRGSIICFVTVNLSRTV